MELGVKKYRIGSDLKAYDVALFLDGIAGADEDVGTIGFGSMSFEAFRSWQEIVNLSQSWLSMREAKGEAVMLSEHFSSDDDGSFRCTLLLS